MEGYKIILGYAPTTRGGWPYEAVAGAEKAVRAKVDELVEKFGDVELVDISEVATYGMVWNKDEIQNIVDYLVAKKVDALFIPHCNFGEEEAVAKVAKGVNRPVLLWGPRDPEPEGEAFRPYDAQCGMFATSKALASYKVPFTYLENCAVDSPVLEKGLDAFIRVASVVKSIRGMRVGQLGVRPRPFLSMKINESELLQKFGIEITSVWPEEIESAVKKLMEEKDPEIARRVEELKAALTEKDNTTKEVVHNAFKTLDSKYGILTFDKAFLKDSWNYFRW